MSNQEINIQNNTGTINIYNSPDKEDGDQRKISMSAVDKYSSPLTASINLSPWGDKHYRVSFLLRNDLIGQVIQRNYISFKNKESAKEFFDILSEDMVNFKKQAENERRHNVLIVADIWNLMNKYEKKYNIVNEPESEDLRIRSTDKEIHQNFEGAKPHGLVFHDIDGHFPYHEGIVKSASKKAWYYNIDKNIDYKVDTISEIKSLLNYFANHGEHLVQASVEIKNKSDIKKIANLCISNYLDLNYAKIIKNKILMSLKTCFLSKNADHWIVSNRSLINKISNKIGELGMRYYAEQYKKITQDDYDIFIFDADQTIWEGDRAYEFEEPFSVNGDLAKDKNGHELKLKPGVREMLKGLYEKEKRIGLISHSEKEGLDFQDQPVIKLLKQFDILKYFNEMVVVAKELPKSMFVPTENRVLFIDDDIENLIDVVQNTGADAANPENIVYNPKNIKESISKTGTVLISSKLEYGKDFYPIKVLCQNTKLKRKDWKYWEEKEKEILNEYWYSSDKIEEKDFENFLEDMVSKGIDSNLILEVNDYNPPIFSSVNVLIKLSEEGMKKISPNPYVEAGRPRIKSNEIPEKPNGKGEYQLDHKKPRWKGGKDTKDNLQWIEKNKHKKKTKEEGSYEYGGKDRHKKLKNKGKEEYSKYQSETGKAKIQKERESLGEEAFSEKQRERAKKRWKKSSLN